MDAVLAAINAAMAAAKAAAPVFTDLVNVAAGVGVDVSNHQPIATTLSDAVALLEKALADAKGIL